MRKLILILWLLTPVAAAAYHLGPGQDQMRLDDAATAMDAGKMHAERALELTASEGELAAKSEWAQADEAYTQALELLPDDRVDERRRVRLERAKAQMMVSKLPEANATLTGLVDEMVAEGEAVDAELLRDARRALANSQYYVTWLMRLEGAPTEVQLFVSQDAGKTWRYYMRRPPNGKSFPFRTTGDGHFWFAPRTIDPRRNAP